MTDTARDRKWKLVDMVEHLIQEANDEPQFSTREHALMAAGEIEREYVAAEIAAAEKRGAERALRDFRRFMRRASPRGLVSRDQLIADVQESLKRLDETGYMLTGPLIRADEIERTTDEH